MASQRNMIDQSLRFVTELLYAHAGRELELLLLGAMTCSVSYLSTIIEEPGLFKCFDSQLCLQSDTTLKYAVFDTVTCGTTYHPEELLKLAYLGCTRQNMFHSRRK